MTAEPGDATPTVKAVGVLIVAALILFGCGLVGLAWRVFRWAAGF